MKTRKTIILFAVFSISLLLLAGCETANNSQSNILTANTVAIPENNKQKEPKPKEQKSDQTNQQTNIKIDNNLSQPINEVQNNSNQTKVEANNNLSDSKTNSKTLKEKPKAEEIKSEETKYYKVIKVVDGDTVAVDIDGVSETLRLIGINTPETVDPRKTVECFGVEASNKAKELLTGKLVTLEKDNSQDERDKYSRLLRYVKTKEGLFYNLEIIKLGYAYEYTYNTPYKYQSEFKEAENYARTNKLGLWSDKTCGGKLENSTAVVPAPIETKSTETTIKPPETKTQCECSSNKYNCTDFKTQAEAQALFECCGGAGHDIHRLDSDKDGKVCESLP
ncbi:MAG: thermonuclease family protein [Patescibacteria group bacterium]|jgi:micrococcal nuclease